MWWHPRAIETEIATTVGVAGAERMSLPGPATETATATATAAVASGLVAILTGDVDAARAHTARRPDVLDGFTRLLADRNVAWLRSPEGATRRRTSC
jgi:hypothetical protein